MSNEIKDLSCEEFFSNCLGIAEETDASSIVVSEETGNAFLWW